MSDLQNLVIRQSALILDQLEQINDLSATVEILEAEMTDGQAAAIGVWEAQARNLEDRLGEIMEAIGGWIDGDFPSNAGGSANVTMSWVDYNKLRAAFRLEPRQPKRAAPSVTKTGSVTPATEAVTKLMNHGVSQLAALLDAAEDE
jgi:hypothetical protein